MSKIFPKFGVPCIIVRLVSLSSSESLMASVEGLVPITRVVLSQYYDKYPLPPQSDEVPRLTEELRALSTSLQEEHPLANCEKQVAHEVDALPPHKIDENMWKNREHIEEILFLLDESQLPKLFQQQVTPEDIEMSSLVRKLEIKLQDAYKTLECFQLKNANNVFNTVMTYMPQDIRGSLIRQQRERSESKKQADVDALMNSGGSIREKYALLWKQQMERRTQLAQLGSATGVYKALVKYLVGVPQVLLDFLRELNDEHGPMEEQRQRYGPPFYSLTKLVLCIRFYLLLSWGRYESRKLSRDQRAILEHAVNVYTSELRNFLNFIGDVIANSPFLISAEEAGAPQSRKNEDYKETIIPPGKNFVVSLMVDSVNSYIAWDFSVIQGKMNMDIGFSIEHISSSGEITMILPYKRYESDQGSFSTVIAGCYKLMWDNSYSTFFRKNLRYKVDAIPPVVDIPQQLAENRIDLTSYDQGCHS